MCGHLHVFCSRCALVGSFFRLLWIRGRDCGQYTKHLGRSAQVMEEAMGNLQAQHMNDDGADQMDTNVIDQPQSGRCRKLLNLITSVFPGWLRSWPFASASQTGEHNQDTEITACSPDSSLHQVVQDMDTWPKYLCRSPASRKSLILRTTQTLDEGGPMLDLDWVDCLKLPSEGLTIEEAEDFESLLSGMLKYDPEERIDLDTIGSHRWFSKGYPVPSEDDWLKRWF